MKKIIFAVCLILTAFFSFFDPLEPGFNLTVTSLSNGSMLAVGVVCFFVQYEKLRRMHLKVWELCFALILGACMTLGFSLLRQKGFDIFYASLGAAAFSVSSLVYYCFFSVCLMKLFFVLVSSEHKRSKLSLSVESNRFTGKVYAAAENNSFLFYFAFFMVVWGIVLIVNFPGIIMFDTRNQVAMFYGVENHHTNASVLINPAQLITQHHSVLHTLLVGYLFKLGKDIFSSFEAGIFIYCLIQYTVMSLITAYMFRVVRRHLSTGWTLFWLMLFGLHPFFGIGAILVTKDIYFCGFFILYMLKYLELLHNPSSFRKPAFAVEFILINLALVLLRNNAIYSLIIISLLLLVLLRGERRWVLVCTAVIIAFNMLYTSFLPKLDISPGSPREMLSVPFQQTAYYINKFEDEVTPGEKAAISAVLDYETLRTQYNPEKSDPVKDTYKKHATSKDIAGYFKAWWQMFLKHPGSYVESFLSLNYGYYSPGLKTDPMNYHCYNDMRSKRAMTEDGFDTLNTSEPGFLQDKYFSYQGFMFKFPFFCLVTDTGIHVWIWIFMMLYVIRTFKNPKKYLMYYIPFFAYMIFILVGPVNGTLYVRYVMPFVYTLPLAFLPLAQKQSIGSGSDSPTK